MVDIELMKHPLHRALPFGALVLSIILGSCTSISASRPASVPEKPAPQPPPPLPTNIISQGKVPVA